MQTLAHLCRAQSSAAGKLIARLWQKFELAKLHDTCFPRETSEKAAARTGTPQPGSSPQGFPCEAGAYIQCAACLGKEILGKQLC